MIKTHYQIEWLVPRENAIGGKGYWTPIELASGQYTTIDMVAAFDLFDTHKSDHHPGSTPTMANIPAQQLSLLELLDTI